MGKLARMQELEREIDSLKKENANLREVSSFIETLAELPDDAVILYTLSGQRLQCEIGRAAKVFSSKIGIG